ncbi:MAG: hypothetical protein HXX16_18895 [Bacteroidales bacterium]|nr:hypothetical protein [Bacteroidales bacterium]
MDNINQVYADNFKIEIDRKLVKASILRDYAIEKGFDIPDNLLDALNDVKLQITNNQIIEVGGELDKIIRDFSQLVSPATFESIYSLRYFNKNGDSKNPEIDDVERFDKEWFYKLIIFLSIMSIILGVSSFYFIKINIGADFFKSLLAICLGLLGSLIFTIFNVIGEIKERTFNTEEKAFVYFRIIVGPLLGWLFFISFAYNAYSFDSSTIDTKSSLLVFLPFLAGFSTRFVIGVINKLISVFELTLGLQDMDTQRRKKKIK